MSQSIANLRALGLNYSPNQLSLPPGSMIQADDIVIRRDDTVESRRGLRRQSEQIGSSVNRPKQLIEYKNRIIAHLGSTLSFDTGTLDSDTRAIYNDFNGSYSETQEGLRIKYIEANKNLYFTTSDGIKKISVTSASDFTTQPGFIQNAGAVKALDISAELIISQGEVNGFLPIDSAVAYRAVWGYKDANNNVLLGTPSNSVTIFNFLSDAISMDINAFSDMLDKLDQTGSLFTNGNYADTFYIPVGSQALTLQSTLIALATAMDENLYLASITGSGEPLTVSTIALANNIVTITFSSGNPSLYFQTNDSIELRNLDYTSSPFADINGTHIIDLAITTNTIAFTFTHANITSGTPTTCDIYSNNYRNIINTGNTNFPNPLASLVISSPATSGEIRTIQDSFQRIVDRIKSELTGIISTPLQTTYVAPFLLTQSANTRITATIPENITAAYFIQLYRTRIFTATDTQTLGGEGGIPVTPDDEMRQVFEVFPTTEDITNGYIIFNDLSPDELVQNNTNLYTNEQTGDGILQANDPPPFAMDINTYKNVTFYANTRSKQNITIFQLLGVSNIVSNDSITISDGTNTDTYTFVTGVAEQTSILFTAGSTVTSGQYYTLNTPNNDKNYVFWQRVNGVGTAPVISGSPIYIPVDILSTDTNLEVAYKNKSAINIQIFDFTAVNDTPPTILITNQNEGKTTDATAGTSPFTVTVVTQGNGEDATNKQVLLSSLVSPAQAIQETAESLVRVINKQSDSVVDAYYISGDTTPPGQINLQAKTFSVNPFYILGSSTGIGTSFNPDVSPINTNITSISVANPTVLTFSTPHGLINGNQIMIAGSNSTPSINGLQTVTKISSTTVSIPVNVTVAGTSAVWSLPTDSTISTNDVNPNRVYYSKISQPEAVPIVNFFDISAQDRAILRILPLRDSLFAFKEDGTYRISGQVAPWVVDLLDSSCIVISPDTVSYTNNVIYAWTSKGITPITESGAGSEISRPIDNQILSLASQQYPNFSTITWGFGYDSDNSYTVFTNSNPTDVYATIGFRYCTLTNTWTNIQRSQTCGVIIPEQDKLYLGSGTSNTIDVERKDFLRTDYADDDFSIFLAGNSLATDGVTLQFTTVANINPGDVITQVQLLTTYQFNSLLNQLDTDPSLQNNYFVTLQANPGDNLRSKIVALASKLDSDPGTNFKNYSARIATTSGTITSNSISNPTIVTSSSITNLIEGRIVTISGTENGSIPSITGTYQVSGVGTFGSSETFSIPVDVLTGGTTGLTFDTAQNLNSFEDIEACYNDIISRLNADTSVTYSSYQLITTTSLYEAVVLSVNYIKNKVVVNIPIEWVVGDMTVYEAINCEWTYAPITFGDALSTKQAFDTTLLFRDRAITGFTANFSSDLFPEFVPVVFTGQGNGIFGHYSPPGFGYGYFGGAGNSAPFRTYIPMNAQRCRYINLKLTHNFARETWYFYGATLTAKTGVSFRGYR